jgi:hypothetical protein
VCKSSSGKMRRYSPHRQKQPECLRMLAFVALPRTADPACCDSWDRRPHRRCSRRSQDHGTSGVQQGDHGASRHRSIQRVHFRGSTVHRQPDRPDQDRERPLSSLTPESSATLPSLDYGRVARNSGVIEVIMVLRGENGAAAFPGKSRNRDGLARSPIVSGSFSLGSRLAG